MKYDTAIAIMRIQEEIRSTGEARRMKETAQIKPGDNIPEWIQGYLVGISDALSSIEEVINKLEKLK